MTSKRFEGRTALITGAAGGIGHGIASRFAAEGARVALVDQNAERGGRAAERIRSGGGEAAFFQADVSDDAQVREAVARAAGAFSHIDHLVNNAGIVLVKALEDSTPEDWDRVLGVNAKSVFLTVKHALPWLRRSPAPTVVNIGSVSSFVAQQNTPFYVASKGAVLMLSKALAIDLAPGIRVNCVCPGITDTEMLWEHVNKTPDPEETARRRLSRVPLGRMLKPSDIAGAVLFLSHPDSSGITGASLNVDAGYTAAAEWSSDSGTQETRSENGR